MLFKAAGLAAIVSIIWWAIASFAEWIIFPHVKTYWDYYALMGWREWLVRMTSVAGIFITSIIFGTMQKARQRVKTLERLVPICAWCKNKIRTDAGGWQNVDEYMSARNDVAVSHTICPECMESTLKTIS